MIHALFLVVYRFITFVFLFEFAWILGFGIWNLDFGT